MIDWKLHDDQDPFRLSVTEVISSHTAPFDAL